MRMVFEYQHTVVGMLPSSDSGSWRRFGAKCNSIHSINLAKWALYPSDLKWIHDQDGIILLGAPVGGPVSAAALVQSRVDKIKKLCGLLASLDISHVALLKVACIYRQFFSYSPLAVLQLFSQLHSSFYEFLVASAGSHGSRPTPNDALFVGQFDEQSGTLLENGSLKSRIQFRVRLDAVTYGGSNITAEEFRGTDISSTLTTQKGLSCIEDFMECFSSKRRLFILQTVRTRPARNRRSENQVRAIMTTALDKVCIGSRLTAQKACARPPSPVADVCHRLSC
jgi:hypothetical protein